MKRTACLCLIAFALTGCATTSRPLAGPQANYAAKTTPVAADKVLITDSQDGWKTKNVLFSAFGSGSLEHATSDGTYYASRNGEWASLTGVFAAPLGVNDNYLTDAQVTLLSNTSGTNTGDQNGAGVAFTDTDNLFIATNLQAAIEEFNNSINSGVPNGVGAKVHWSQILGVPSVFADGTDDGPAGEGISHATSDNNYYASRNGVWASLTGIFAAPLGTNDNYVTDAEKIVIGNTSGVNNGDQTSVSGNAGTATKLQAARTIGGVAFDGSANISLPGVNTAGNQNTTGTAANLSGTPTLPNGTRATTQAAGDASTKIATTAYVNTLMPAGVNGQYGVWLTNNTISPATYSVGKQGYTSFNGAPYWCSNGTCSAIALE